MTNVSDNSDRPVPGLPLPDQPLPGQPGVGAAGAARDEAEGASAGPAVPAHGAYEQVVFCHDAPTGLRAIIAIYSTALGPALGGTRFYPYPSEEAALADVLNLARAMAYKNAMAGPGSRRRQGRHHRRSAAAEVRGAAARLRPVRAVAERPVHHRLRRRHLQRGHGHRGPRVPARDREDGAERRRGRLLGADGVRRLPGDARGRRARLGHEQPGGPPGRRRRRGQGRAPPRRPPHRGRRAGGDLRREPGRRGPGAGQAPRGRGRGRPRQPARPARSTSSRRARSAARQRRQHRRC